MNGSKIQGLSGFSPFDGTPPESPRQPTSIPDFEDEPESPNEKIIREIVGVEREMFFEKRNSKTERQRKVKEVIERFTKLGET